MTIDISPQALHARWPMSDKQVEAVMRGRSAVQTWFADLDPRMLVIVGPCSMDGSVLPSGELAAAAFARRLAVLAATPLIRDRLLVCLRMPPHKPRTVLGWRGLGSVDPDAAFQILVECTNYGLPIFIEAMNERLIARFKPALSGVWVGRRSVEMMREPIAFHSDLPAFFKNGNLPRLKEAIDATTVARFGPQPVEVTRPDGSTEIATAHGNGSVGILFRGWEGITESEFAQMVQTGKSQTGMMGIGDPQKFVVDPMHAFADRQASVARLMEQVRDGADIDGVMLESYIRAGRADSPKPGQSKTDWCLSWFEAVNALKALAEAVGPK